MAFDFIKTSVPRGVLDIYVKALRWFDGGRCDEGIDFMNRKSPDAAWKMLAEAKVPSFWQSDLLLFTSNNNYSTPLLISTIP